jgi:beta-lactam-binding protein with PASTA domain
MMLRITKILALLILFLAITGGTAYLTLTWIVESEDTVVVPDLVGKDVVYALEILTDLGLNTKIKGSQYSDIFAKNYVTLQEPGPGAEIKKGRDVRIVLSKGMKTVVMPNLAGLSSRQGRLVIEENGLCVGRISKVYYDASVAKDEIIAQTPSKNKTINRGQCVNLLFSLGPRPRAFKMSAFEGLSTDEAVVLIERSHLQVGRLRYDYQPRKPENVIIDQDPEPGYRVLGGTPVNLVVNRKPGGKKALNSDQKQSSGFYVHRLPSGFLKKQVKVRLDSVGISSELCNELMDPGEELWLLVPTYQTATLFIYEDDTLVKTQVFSP